MPFKCTVTQKLVQYTRSQAVTPNVDDCLAMGKIRNRPLRIPKGKNEVCDVRCRSSAFWLQLLRAAMIMSTTPPSAQRSSSTVDTDLAQVSTQVAEQPQMARSISSTLREIRRQRETRLERRQATKVRRQVAVSLILVFALTPNVVGLVIYSSLGSRSCYAGYEQQVTSLDLEAPRPAFDVSFGWLTIGGLTIQLAIYVVLALCTFGFNEPKDGDFSYGCCTTYVLGLAVFVAVANWFYFGLFIASVTLIYSFPFERSTFNMLVKNAQVLVSDTSCANETWTSPMDLPSHAMLDTVLAVAGKTCEDTWMRGTTSDGCLQLFNGAIEVLDTSTSWCGGGWGRPSCDHADPCVYLWKACDADLYPAACGLAIFWAVVALPFVVLYCILACYPSRDP